MFASFAFAARHNAQKEARYERLAREAYDAACRFSPVVNWSAQERSELARKTQQLERKLADLIARKA